MNVLVVDDELSMREYLEELLSRGGYTVTTASSYAEFVRRYEESAPDLVISDMKIGRDSGRDVLRYTREQPDAPEVILITAYGEVSSAVQATREGAYDFHQKPFDNNKFLLACQNALEKRGIIIENARLRKKLLADYLEGSSEASRPVWALVDKVAQAARSTVLITGESGTGKEVVARAIHFKSPRAAKPFVPVNCGALAEGVLQSELFGHTRGSFTGASSDRTGILVSAGEGTVLLDEVGELPQSTQVMLLRVLQERKVKPVGSSTEIPFDARILAATNRDLEAEVKAGRFREDLFFRLNVIHIELPPLRKCREDIIPLARYFLARFAQELGRPALRFAPETLEVLSRYPFSGNVRQLKNFIERAATLADGDVLQPDTLPPAVRGEEERPGAATPASPQDGFSLEKHLDQLERHYLLDALARAGGVKTRAAELLGLTFRSFRYRLAKHGLGEREEDTH